MARSTKIPKQNRRYKPKSVGAKRLHICVWLILLTLLFSGLSVGLYYYDAKKSATEITVDNDTTIVEGGFGIKSIDVEGNVHYSKDQIISASGLFLGKSIWKINKTQSSLRIRNACPYVESVRIRQRRINQITIEVKETSIGGAIYSDKQWIIVGKNGQGIDKMDVKSDLPGRYIYYKGVTAIGTRLGRAVMDEQSEKIFKEFTKAFEDHNITNVTEVDMSDISNLTVNWNNQITVYIGNDSNIDYEIAIMEQTLPKVLKNHGKQAHGTLDISSYSNKELTNQVIFTPDN